MPVWYTVLDAVRTPCGLVLQNRTSPGRRSAYLIRFETGRLAAMSYVVRHRILEVPFHAVPLTLYARFITHQTNPEQSNPPWTFCPSATCGWSDEPPQTYGAPEQWMAKAGTALFLGR